MATDRSKYLLDVIDSYKLSKEQDLLDKFKSKRDEVKAALIEMYGSSMYSTFNSGSYAKNTAINVKFDFDHMAPFKRNAFSTLKDMYDDMFIFLKEQFGDQAHIRKQKVSIGIEFYADEDGDVVKIDVVPGRELNQGQYNDDKTLNLYVYSQFGSLSEGSDYIRSNIHKQIENIRDNSDRSILRKVIRLLKVWKAGENRSYPKSFFIELIVIKAFEKEEPEGNLWETLRTVLVFIKENVKTITLPDPGNSGNDVSKTLTDAEKELLSWDIANMVDRIDESSDTIKYYFPVNEEHAPEEDKYETSGSGFSVPPPVKFG